VDEVMGHNKQDLEAILKVLEQKSKRRAQQTAQSPEFLTKMDEYNISKLKKMKKHHISG
jgi:hypothetical protein